MDADEILLKDIKHLSDIKKLNGDIETVSGIENLRLALLHRLVTLKGSLVHRPEYGVGIQKWQNSMNTIDNQRAIASAIVENFERDPRVISVESVEIASNDDPSLVRINVKVIAVGRQEAVELNYMPFIDGIRIS